MLNTFHKFPNANIHIFHQITKYIKLKNYKRKEYLSIMREYVNVTDCIYKDTNIEDVLDDF